MTQFSYALVLSFIAIIFLGVLHAISFPMLGEEMRYASVAWRMFMEKEWFLPHLGSHLYLHKTPLLFWCLHLGWWISVSFPWHIVFPLFFSLLTVFYTQKLAGILFPDHHRIIFLSPLVLIAMPFFVGQVTSLRFDMMLTLFNIMACYFLIKHYQSQKIYDYGLFILANGLGLLAKGPVIYIFTLIELMVFLRYFRFNIKQVLYYFLGILISLSFIMIWWAPLIAQAGFAPIQEMLTTQVVARATGAISIAKPWWDYFMVLPAFLLPWGLFYSFWSCKTERILHALGAIFVFVFILLSCIKTKESRYLLPIAPLFAIVIAARLEKINLLPLKFPSVLLCLGGILLFIAQHFFIHKIHIFYALYFSQSLAYVLFFLGLMLFLKKQASIGFILCLSFFIASFIDTATTIAISKTQDVTPTVEFIRHLEEQHIPVVSTSALSSDWQFAGRDQHPLPIISDKKTLEGWMLSHPHGWVITSRAYKNNVAYAIMSGDCFEQSYDHLRSTLSVCPVDL